MRLKTQSHLITIALTGLVVWQVAHATRTEPEPATEAVAESEPSPEAQTPAPEEARRVRSSPPTVRPRMLLTNDSVVVQASPDESGSVRARDLVAALAKAMNTTFTLDDDVTPIRLNLGGETTLTRDQLRNVLRNFHVVLVVSPTGVISAHHVRNVGSTEPPPWRLLHDGEAADPDQLVTRVIPIYNGAGNAIFATLRGLSCRDSARLGNSLYVPGSEVVIVSDLAINVSYYEQVVHQLDVPTVPFASE